MELRFLKDEELEMSFHRAVKTERKIMYIVLLHIQEIERRKLYLAREFESIHKYLTSVMKYSSSSATRRIHAAILVTAIPSIAQKIESGEINLTQIGKLQRAVKNAEKIHQEKVTTEQKAELVEKIINLSTSDSQQVCDEALSIPAIEAQFVKVQKSRRVGFTFSERQFAKYEEIRGMLAHKNFQAMRTQDIRDVLETLFDEWTTLQMPKGKSHNRNTVAKQDPNAEAEFRRRNAVSKKECKAESKSQNRKSVSKIDCEAGEVFAMAINADTSTDESADEPADTPMTPTQCETGTAKLESGKNNSGHNDAVNLAVPISAEDQSQSKKIDRAEFDLENLDKAKWHSLTPKRKKLILQRDQCCQYIDDQSQDVCGSKFNLHVDHIQPKWAGGNNNPGNLRVLCREHNLYRYSHRGFRIS